jgi:iron complex outermembrane receptor protein
MTSVAVGALIGTGAIAAPVAVAAPDAQAAPMGEVVVTAQKREQKLSKVPIAISAYTSKSRDLIGLDTLQDYTNFTPGLSYSSGNDRVYLRGVGRQTNTIGSDPGVATYNDGAYNASTSAVSEDSLFLARTEILRGPQGTLFGRNSIGGAINAISKQPTNDYEGEVRANFGNYGVYNVEGAVSGPIADGVRFRLAGMRDDQEDGYFRNVAGGPDEGGRGVSYYVEGQLDAALAPNLDAWVKVFASDDRSEPRSSNLVGPYDRGAFPVGSLTPGAAFGYTTAGFVALGHATTNPGSLNYRDFSTNTPSVARLHDNPGLTFHLDWRLPGVDVKYIGAIQHYTFDSTTDLDGTSMVSYKYPLNPAFNICSLAPGCTPLTVFPSQEFNYVEDKTFWSNELDFSSSTPGPLQWIAGLYEYGERFTQEDHFSDPSQPQLKAPANGPANPSGDFVDAGGNLDTASYAVFGQADWNLTSAFKLTGGLRYTWDHKFGTEHLREICFGLPSCTFPPDSYGSLTPALDITASQLPTIKGPGAVNLATINSATGIATRQLSDSWSALTGTAGGEWTPDSDTMAYAKYSRGYKSGGFNEGGISVLPETQPEYIDAFELGVKKQVGHELQLDAATYYYIYKGFQIPLTVNTPGGASLTQFFNLQQVNSYGVELEASWQPTPQLQFLLSYSYLNATVSKGCCFVDGADPTAQLPGAHPVGALVNGQRSQSVVGQTVPESPRNKIGVNANYTFDFSPGSLTLSASYIWKDQTYESIFNRFYTLAPSYSQVDIRALWTDTANRYTLIVYAKNLFDTKGYDGASGAQLTSPPAAPLSVTQTYSYLPPRTFGIELQYRFR